MLYIVQAPLPSCPGWMKRLGKSRTVVAEIELAICGFP